MSDIEIIDGETIEIVQEHNEIEIVEAASVIVNPGGANLTTTIAADSVTIRSSSGTDAIIPAATPTAAGAQSATDKAKLDGIATGATANSTDAELRDRATHTGTQPIATVSGLQSALDGKQPLSAKLTTIDGLTGITPIRSDGTNGPLTDAEIPASIARDAEVTAEVSAAITAHEAEADPHPQYLTQAEGDAAYAPIGVSGATNLSTANRNGSTLDITSDTGTDATIPAATTTLAGLITGASQTKLDGIEAGATADQTGAEIKALYEAEPNTNVFADADKTKLDGIQPGATANSTDAQLRDRATHTGTQAISTVSGLQSALDGKDTAGNKTLTPTAIDPGNTATNSGFLSWLLSAVRSAQATLAGLGSLATRDTVSNAEITDINAVKIDAGTIDIARIPTGATATTVAIGNDARLSDERTPLDGSVTDAKVAAAANIAWGKISKTGAVPGDVGAQAASAKLTTIDGLTGTTPIRSDGTNGPLTDAEIPNLDASKITTGTFGDNQIPASIARDTEVSAAITAHEAEADPHSQYLTQAEGDALYDPLGSTGTTNLDTANRNGSTLDITSDTGTDATIPAATTTLAGLITGASQTKLDGIEAGATANSADAQLRDRATHTGTQAISTVSGLPSALDGKQPLDSDLTAIAASGTGATGLQVLQAANAAAVRTATGLSATDVVEFKALGNTVITQQSALDGGGNAIDTIYERIIGADSKYSITLSNVIKNGDGAFNGSTASGAHQVAAGNVGTITIDFTPYFADSSFPISANNAGGFRKSGGRNIVRFLPGSGGTNLKIEYLCRNVSTDAYTTGIDGTYTSAATINTLAPDQNWFKGVRITIDNSTGSSTASLFYVALFPLLPFQNAKELSFYLRRFGYSENEKQQVFSSARFRNISGDLYTDVGQGTFQLNGGATLSQMLTATKSVTTGSAMETITVTGAQVGDLAWVSRGFDAYVSAANTVTFNAAEIMTTTTVRAVVQRFA